MPQFCRHNRILQNCTICSREQAVEPRPLVSSSAPRVAEPRRAAASPRRRPGPGPRAAGVTVRRVRSSSDDGFRSPLVPGLKSSQEARRLAEEIAFAQTRLNLLAASPPGLYAEVADARRDLEERTWLAFLIAYLGPLEHEPDPFAAISERRTSWASGELPELDGAAGGPRGAHEPDKPTPTLSAYRAWARRGGSQALAVAGEPGWEPARRFARTYERLSLPGLHRDARFEFLTSLGLLGAYELDAGTLVLGGGDTVTVAAKRALGIGDPMLLGRRAAQLAAEAGVRLAALDLGFYNWERGARAHVGVPGHLAPEPGITAAALGALGLAPDSET